MTKAREGLNELLKLRPDDEVLTVQRQVQDDDAPHHLVRGPWTVVDLIENYDLQSVRKYAIWNLTGDVYVCGERGDVGDDPIIRVPV